MERERFRDTLDRHAGGLPADDGMGDLAAECEELIARADEMLDSVQLNAAEHYLTMNQQRGGQ